MYDFIEITCPHHPLNKQPKTLNFPPERYPSPVTSPQTALLILSRVFVLAENTQKLFFGPSSNPAGYESDPNKKPKPFFSEQVLAHPFGALFSLGLTNLTSPFPTQKRR